MQANSIHDSLRADAVYLRLRFHGCVVRLERIMLTLPSQNRFHAELLPALSIHKCFGA